MGHAEWEWGRSGRKGKEVHKGLQPHSPRARTVQGGVQESRPWKTKSTEAFDRE